MPNPEPNLARSEDCADGKHSLCDCGYCYCWCHDASEQSNARLIAAAAPVPKEPRLDPDIKEKA